MTDNYLVEAFFLFQCANPLFAVYYQPATASAKEVVLFASPFGDEMNKSRRMINLQAQRYCDMGYAVLIVDLYGTGDSFGEFVESTWTIWRENLHYAWKWLKTEKNMQSVHFWGIRLGCLLALDTAREYQLPVTSYLLWQPVVSGERYVKQLLRLRIAERFGQQSKETVKGLMKKSAGGESLEIAGYMVNPELLQTMNKLTFDVFCLEKGHKVIWLECTTAELAVLPRSQRIIDRWMQQEVRVQAESIRGSSFWNSVEIEQVPELIEKSCNLFKESLNGCK